MSAPDESTSDLLNAVGELLPESRAAVSFDAGVTVFSQGDQGDNAYLVETGSLRITRTVLGRERTVAMAGPGDIVGELGLLDSGERGATVIAVTDCQLLVVTREQITRETRESPPLVRLLLRVMLERYRSINKLTEDVDDETQVDGDGDGDGDYSPQDTTQLKAVHEVRLEQQLHDAIKRKEFELYYQPVVNIAARKLVGFEALVRWMRPDVGMVPPSEFVWLAERSGLIVPLGAWVLEDAARFAQEMRAFIAKAGGRISPPFISVNVSPRQLEKEESVSSMVRLLEESGVAPGAIKLEITENMLLDNPEASIAALNRLKATGATLAVDDFGTGYASLSYMPRYPLDTLKIDRSFVSDIADSGNRQVVRSMVVLARGLGMDIVAEGVETHEQLEALAKLKCDNGQGFLFAKPMPERRAMRLVARAVDTRAADTTRAVDTAATRAPAAAP